MIDKIVTFQCFPGQQVYKKPKIFQISEAEGLKLEKLKIGEIQRSAGELKPEIHEEPEYLQLDDEIEYQKTQKEKKKGVNNAK